MESDAAGNCGKNETVRFPLFGTPIGRIAADSRLQKKACRMSSQLPGISFGLVREIKKSVSPDPSRQRMLGKIKGKADCQEHCSNSQ